MYLKLWRISCNSALSITAGQGGIGKSTAMKQLALSWADGSADDLQKFDFIFHIELKAAKKHMSIEELVIKQHTALNAMKVDPQEIRAIIEGNQNQKVLLLLDGHDEYKRGNKDIDDALKKMLLRRCWVLVTSRESKELQVIRQYVDAEAKIIGFDEKRIYEYMKKYLGSSEKCEELLTMAEDSTIIKRDSGSDIGDYGILRIPILLHMICCLFLRRVSLPKSKTGMLSAIVERCGNWETIRKTGKKRDKSLEQTIFRLGKLAMEGLQREELQQSFDKVTESNYYRNYYIYILSLD